MTNPYEFSPHARAGYARAYRVLVGIAVVGLVVFLCAVGWFVWCCYQDWPQHGIEQDEDLSFAEGMTRARDFFRGVVQRHELAGLLRGAVWIWVAGLVAELDAG